MEEMKNEGTMSEEQCVITPPLSMPSMQRRINRTSKVWAIVIIAVSVFLLAALFASLVLTFLAGGQDVAVTVVLIFLALCLLFFGIFLLMSIKKTEQFEARRNYEERTRFLHDHAEVITYRKEEVVAKEKLYYCDLFAVHRKKNLLLLYVTAASAHVVDLSLLPPADVEKVSEYLRIFP